VKGKFYYFSQLVTHVVKAICHNKLQPFVRMSSSTHFHSIYQFLNYLLLIQSCLVGYTAM
jgi:hypothetical protein